MGADLSKELVWSQGIMEIHYSEEMNTSFDSSSSVTCIADSRGAGIEAFDPLQGHDARYEALDFSGAPAPRPWVSGGTPPERRIC